jgi:Flp pilus assembly secretin CpaC
MEIIYSWGCAIAQNGGQIALRLRGLGTHMLLTAQELIVGQVATDFTHQITMSPGSSTSWTTPRAVRDVNIPRPEVADVVPQSDRTLLITGWAPGQTQILLLDDCGQQVANLNVVVSARENLPPSH